MLRRLDAAILNKLDRATTYAQRRGILLTNIHVGACGATLLLTMSSHMIPTPDPFGVGLSVVVWGSWLFGYLIWAKDNKDYPTSSRMMERLNVAAVHLRESEYFMRCFWLFLLLLTVAGCIFRLVHYKDMAEIASAVLNNIGCACATTMWYLNGCMFLGPGHFAKNRKEKSILNAITLRG